MEQNKAIQYKALDNESYNALAAHAVNFPATVTLHPKLSTIVVCGDWHQKIRDLIHSESLSFQVEPIEFNDDSLEKLIDSDTTDAGTLREIIFRLINEKADAEDSYQKLINDITAQRDEARKGRDEYSKWWHEANFKNDRVKDQVKAIAVMINSIFPER